MKSLFDRLAAFFGLIVLSPVLAIIWIAIASQRDGPPIFHQRRVGQHQKPFTLYKFRTLPRDTANMPTHEVDQSRANAVGRFVRRTKLDELPQLWNVLRGEMSLVGPRPGLTTQNDLIAEREKRGVFAIKPGITGHAQINGIDMRDVVKLAEADHHYLQTRSFGRDLLILSATLGLRAGKRHDTL